MRRLRLPDRVNVQITEYFGAYNMSSTSLSWIAPPSVDLIAIIPTFGDTTAVKLSLDRRHLELSCKWDPTSSHAITLEAYLMRGHEDCDFGIIHGVWEGGVTKLFRILSITSIELSVDFDFKDFADFLPLFAALSGVEVLTISGTGAYYRVITSLGWSPSLLEDQSSEQLTDTNHDATPHLPRDVFLPRLHSLTLTHSPEPHICGLQCVPLPSKVLENLLDMIDNRRSCGAARLEELKIMLPHDSEQEYTNSREDYTRSLRGLVGSIVYGRMWRVSTLVRSVPLIDSTWEYIYIDPNPHNFV